MKTKSHPSEYQGVGPLFDASRADDTNTTNLARMDFDGVTYDPKFDATRLRGEMARVYRCMSDGLWRTLSEISWLSQSPEASVSARLRDLRKPKFGSHTVNRRRSGDPKRGIFEYQLL